MREHAPPRRFDERWRLSRAGIVNVWHYLDNTFDLSGGRMILRGSNGSGKSRALEMLLPFLLDADKRRMDATGAARVNFDELMRSGADGQTTRTGYLWLELARPGQYLTIGALIRHSRSAQASNVWYFTTPLRVGHNLQLMSAERDPLGRDELTTIVGAERITDSPVRHRDRIRDEVFDLGGDAGRDRFHGLLQLLHTLRSPDVGNRIDEGKLPQILLDSLPPLGEHALARAGEQLDGLTDTRAAQQRLEQSAQQVEAFLAVYRRYAIDTLLGTAHTTAEAADALDEAGRVAEHATNEHARLQQDYATAQSTDARLRSELDELDNAIRGIEKREIFKTADDLLHRDRAVTALAQSADQALAGAQRERDGHARAVHAAEQRLDDVEETATETAATLAALRASARVSGLPDATLPTDLRSTTTPQEHPPVVLRTRRDADPQPVARPRPTHLEVVPADHGAVAAAIAAVGVAAAQRHTFAGRRLAESRRLVGEEQRVQRHESDAERLNVSAVEDEQHASTAATARDDIAVDLARAWRQWTNDEQTVALLGDVDWTSFPGIVAAHADLEAFTGDEFDDTPQFTLRVLDASAEQAARPARSALADHRALLSAADAAAAEHTVVLSRERTELDGQRDPQPPQPPWLATERPGEPFWRCVDFADHLLPADRAGLEGALLAAGLLSATLDIDGAVRAADGELLLTPTTPTAPERALSQVLRPDPAAPLPAAVIASVLSCIGLDDDLATTSVSTDGRWRNGPVRGRHIADAARHIGAAARAEHRRRRIADIDAELAELTEQTARRAHSRHELEDRERLLDQQVGAAPRCTALDTARAVAAAAITRAAASSARAERERQIAAESRRVWAEQLATHRATCAHHELPTGADELMVVVDAAQRAVADCRRMTDALRRLTRALARHTDSVRAADEAAEQRDRAESAADHEWLSWHTLAGEVSALHAAIDLTLEQAREELARSQQARGKTDDELVAARRAVAELGPRLGTAAAERDAKAQLVKDARTRMISAAQRLSRHIRVPGLAAAATDQPLAEIERPERIDSVRAAASQVTSLLRAPRAASSANAVLSAFQTFDREVSGQLDVRHTIDDNVHVVQVAGVGADRTLAGAAATLAARVEAGRRALSDKERDVFTTFVLGGVAEELRRRVNQADQLVRAMNASLQTIRTSNGIGVHLGWRLLDEHTSLKRILELVATADAVRTAGQNTELTELLRRRVDDAYAADPSTGYATHLAAALDYRRWHEVGVTILGPEPDRRRPLSRRAKLSQGETRFVSYVTLFAAADGYLTSLGDGGRALRLILLDDAFAKVDDATVAELMGMLVTLDLDFVMTGHALWGCFAQVPKLDIYEVRRSDGSSAVTTHVHWDGRSRVLHPA